MFYRKIYPASWNTIKNNWPLVIFGAFASILGFNELGLIYQAGDSGAYILASLLQSFYDTLYVVSLSEMSIENMPILFLLALMFVAYAALIIMAVSSQGALIMSAKARKNVSFTERLRVGVDRFWPLLTINLLNTLIGYFFVKIIVEQIVFIIANFDIGWITHILLSAMIFFVFIPFIIVIAFVTRYCASYIILEKQDVDTAFINGWRLFRINWLITIESAFFFIVLTWLYIFIVNVVTTYLLSFVAINFTFLGAGVMYFMHGVILLLSSFLYAAYYNVLWTNVYLELTSGEKKHSKIHRVTAKTLPRLAK